MEKIVNEWRRLVDKESDIIFSRANVFLLTNGILVAGLLSGKDLGTITISVISLAGIILIGLVKVQDKQTFFVFGYLSGL